MPRTVPAGLQTNLNATSTPFAVCVRILLPDGRVIAGTTWDKDVDVDVGFGTETYRANATFTRTRTRATVGINADTFIITGAFDETYVKESDMIGGIYRGAEVWSFLFNPVTPANGIMKMSRGNIGKLKRTTVGYEAELRNIFTRLDGPVAVPLEKRCPVELGDEFCKVVLDPPVWAGTTYYNVGDVVKPSVEDGRRYRNTTPGTTDASEPTWDTTIGNTTTETGGVEWVTDNGFIKYGTVNVVSTARRIFSISGLVAPIESANFTDGLITFTSGLNNGLSMEVLDWDEGTLTAILFTTMPFDIVAADGVKLTIGCDKNFETCRDKFLNKDNYRGWGLYAPGPREVARPPAR
jgi:uncharacterized phage protein (TIGR02218 family)